MEKYESKTEDKLVVQVAISEQSLDHGSGDITAEGFDMNEAPALVEAMTSRFLVRVSETACGVCGDGRPCTHTLAEGGIAEPGPSVFGGPQITGYAAAEMVGDYFGAESAASVKGRMEEVGDTLVTGGIALGGHVSDGAVANGFVNPKTGAPQTGCGANDSFKGIVDKAVSNPEFVGAVAKELLGKEEFKAEYTKFVDRETLNGRIADYNPGESLKALAERQNGQNVEVLEGKHAEVLLVFNYVEGTTVDRDAMVAETGKQVFVVDMWYIDKMARAMAQGRPDAETMYPRLKHAMVAFQAGTYLELCDGTHHTVTVKPQEVAVGASL